MGNFQQVLNHVSMLGCRRGASYHLKISPHLLLLSSPVEKIRPDNVRNMVLGCRIGLDSCLAFFVGWTLTFGNSKIALRSGCKVGMVFSWHGSRSLLCSSFLVATKQRARTTSLVPSNGSSRHLIKASITLVSPLREMWARVFKIAPCRFPADIERCIVLGFLDDSEVTSVCETLHKHSSATVMMDSSPLWPIWASAFQK